MSILIGGIDPQKEVAELWYELIKTQAILEIVLKKTSGNSGPVLNSLELQECEKRALQAVQARFPQLGITRK